jgi:surface polysaccharide O-acyltransferase-like enzyme
MLLILPAHALALIGMRGGWNDVESSIFWLIHVFRLPLFFLVAGFFGALLLNARGASTLLRNRAIRIGIPLALGSALVAPLLTLELQGVSGLHRPSVEGIGAFADPHPSYLWFLWYLTLLYVIVLACTLLLGDRATALKGLASRAGHLLSHRAAPLLLAVPAALCLYRQPTWLADAPSESFAPQIDILAYYAIFFVSGWLLFGAGRTRETIEERPRLYMALAAITLPPALALYLLQSEPAIGASRWFHLLALLLLSIATWSLAFGLLGVSRHFLREPSERLRYWADASYWIYLSHFPVMTAMALLLFALPLPEALRLAILTVATLALVYPAYGLFVRHSPIGRILHGPRGRKTPPPQAPQFTRRATAAAPRA